MDHGLCLVCEWRSLQLTPVLRCTELNRLKQIKGMLNTQFACTSIALADRGYLLELICIYCMV